MSGITFSEIQFGRVIINHHLKTQSVPNMEENNKKKENMADTISKKCRAKGWSATVHKWPSRGYCRELDGNWAYPISIKTDIGKRDTGNFCTSIPGRTYTYIIFSVSDLAGNYGAPFYNNSYIRDSNMNHTAISAWSNYDEFTDIVKEVFGDYHKIDKYVRTK